MRPGPLLLLTCSLLAACQAAPVGAPAGPGAPSAAPSAVPALTPLPSASAVPDDPDFAGMLPVAVADAGEQPDLARRVGATLRLRVGTPWSSPAPGAYTWRLDPTSAGRAALAPQPDGSCSVTLQAPGAVTVHAEGRSGRRGRIVLAAVDPAAPARLLDHPAGADAFWPRPGAAVLRSARDWAAYWELARVEPYSCRRCEPPAAPAVDWTRESVVALESGGAWPPVLAAVDATRLVLVEPELMDGRLQSAALYHLQRFYAVPKLGPGVVVDHHCPYPEICPPGGPLPLPEPDPFADLRADQLAVGHPIDLPAGWAGAPLTWAIAPRDAPRASFENRQLTPTAPGPLALTARAGDQAARVLHAVVADPPAVRLIAWTGTNTLKSPQIAADAQAWQRLWSSFYAEANPTVPGAPTAPPPAPPAPGLADTYGPPIAFPANVVVVLPATFSGARWGADRPIATHLAGGTVHLVAPVADIPGRPLSPENTPIGPQAIAIEVPAADAAQVRRVVLDGFPD